MTKQNGVHASGDPGAPVSERHTSPSERALALRYGLGQRDR
jgi:hypothetical protein